VENDAWKAVKVTLTVMILLLLLSNEQFPASIYSNVVWPFYLRGNISENDRRGVTQMQADPFEGLS